MSHKRYLITGRAGNIGSALPLYLAGVIQQQRIEGPFDDCEAHILCSNIYRMQLKIFDQSPRKVLVNMNKLNKPWFLSWNLIKLLVKKLISRN